MSTDRDDFREESGSRDGNSSFRKTPNELIKKKRPRVGDGSAQATGSRLGASNYRSTDSNRSNDRRDTYPPRSTNSMPYRDGNARDGGYNNDSRGGYNNENRPSYNNDSRGGYNNENRPSYNNSNSSRPSYNNSNDSRGGGYNNNRNAGGPSRSGGGSSYPPRKTNNNNFGQNKRFDKGGSNNRRPSSAQEIEFDPNRKVISRKKILIKPVKYKENLSPDAELRLNKYLANAGICSRREADTYISSGVVRVNGIVVSELGAKVKRGDEVTFHDRDVSLESKIYVLLNKPKNCVTTSDDPQNRKTVLDLVKGACTERIYPVGRLDRNTTGVLLLTNDGDLASKLMHPKFKKKKIYQVTLDKDVTMEDMQTIADGVTLDDGEIHADSIAYVSEETLNEVGIEIHSGRNRVVRRIFEQLGYQIVKLDRVFFAGLTKKNVQRGKWRYLSEKEVNMLRMGAYE